MSEVPQIPWGKVISNFIWIVGAAVILTAFSYHEFLRHEEGAKLRDVVRRESFKRPFLAGMILVAAGGCRHCLCRLDGSRLADHL